MPDETAAAGGSPRRLADFVGLWRIERRIDDHRAGQVLRFHGEAALSATAEGLEYLESGEMILPDGIRMPGTRRYFWTSGADGTIEVAFADGRFFHAFDPTETTADARHWCDPDRYAVGYDFSAWPLWSTRWSVNGPRKDYLMKTEFRPS